MHAWNLTLGVGHGLKSAQFLCEVPFSVHHSILHINPLSLQTHIFYQDWPSVTVTAELGNFWLPMVITRHCFSWLPQICQEKQPPRKGKTITFFTSPNLDKLPPLFLFYFQWRKHLTTFQWLHNEMSFLLAFQQLLSLASYSLPHH